MGQKLLIHIILIRNIFFVRSKAGCSQKGLIVCGWNIACNHRYIFAYIVHKSEKDIFHGTVYASSRF